VAIYLLVCPELHALAHHYTDQRDEGRLPAGIA
jgi:hypothetical protein